MNTEFFIEGQDKPIATLEEWNNSKDIKPNIEKKYRVLINCDGEIKESECTYFLSKKKFHFDMPNINWIVIKWMES